MELGYIAIIILFIYLGLCIALDSILGNRAKYKRMEARLENVKSEAEFYRTENAILKANMTADTSDDWLLILQRDDEIERLELENKKLRKQYQMMKKNMDRAWPKGEANGN